MHFKKSLLCVNAMVPSVFDLSIHFYCTSSIVYSYGMDLNMIAKQRNKQEKVEKQAKQDI